MQPEEAVEINHLLPRNIDAGAHCVIGALTMRHNDVQAVGGATLKDDDKPLVAGAGFGRAPCCPREEGGDCCGTYDRHRAALQECPPCDAHRLLTHLRWNSGEPSNNPVMTLRLPGCKGSWNWAIACGPTMRSSIVWCVCFEMLPAIRVCSRLSCT